MHLNQQNDFPPTAYGIQVGFQPPDPYNARFLNTHGVPDLSWKKKTRYRFTDVEIKRVAPTSPGVYFLYERSLLDSVLRLTYIGETNDLKRRLLEHDDGKDGPCTQNAHKFAFERTPSKAKAKRQETVYLDKFKQENNDRTPECND